MLRTVWRALRTLLVLLGLFAVAIAAMRVRDHELRAAVEPPWSVVTLEDFRKWQPQRETALRVESRGSVYYLVHGERGRMLASGPSGYLFDERGNLVSWTEDTGDGGHLRITGGEAPKAVQLSTIPVPARAGR